jgi:hypothetical protein
MYALRGNHSADDNELKQSFSDVLRSQGKKFYNIGTQKLTKHWQKCVENEEDFVENSNFNAKVYETHMQFFCYCY